MLFLTKNRLQFTLQNKGNFQQKTTQKPDPPGRGSGHFDEPKDYYAY